MIFNSVSLEAFEKIYDSEYAGKYYLSMKGEIIKWKDLKKLVLTESLPYNKSINPFKGEDKLIPV